MIGEKVKIHPAMVDCLFVSGPLDGQWKPVPFEEDSQTFKVYTCAMSVAYQEPENGDHYVGMGTQEFIYVPITLLNFAARTTTCFVLDGIPREEVVQRLLKGYKTKPADVVEVKGVA